jgi:hypothetical protein
MTHRTVDGVSPRQDGPWIPRLILTLGALVLLFLAIACDPRLGAAPDLDPPPTDASAQPRDVLRIGQDTKVGGWVVLPEWFGVWVAGGGTLLQIDQKTGEVRQTGRGSWDYDYVQLARYGEGTILLASGRTLWALDARSGGVVQRIDLGQLGSVDAVLQTRSGTWVTATGEDGGVLAKIDLDSGEVMDPIQIGHGRHELVKSAGYLFVGSQDALQPSILRVDPGTGETMPMRWAPGSIAAVGSRLWIASDGEVLCLDAVDLTSCGEVQIPRAASLASDGAQLWVLSLTGSTSSSLYEPDPDQPATVSLLDGVSGEIVGGPLALPSFTPATISAFHGHAWIGFHDEGRVVRIDCEPGHCSVAGWAGQST